MDPGLRGPCWLGALPWQVSALWHLFLRVARVGTSPLFTLRFNVVNRLKKRVRALEKTNLICYYSRDEFTAYYPTWRQS